MGCDFQVCDWVGPGVLGVCSGFGHLAPGHRTAVLILSSGLSSLTHPLFWRAFLWGSSDASSPVGSPMEGFPGTGAFSAQIQTVLVTGWSLCSWGTDTEPAQRSCPRSSSSGPSSAPQAAPARSLPGQAAARQAGAGPCASRPGYLISRCLPKTPGPARGPEPVRAARAASLSPIVREAPRAQGPCRLDGRTPQ